MFRNQRFGTPVKPCGKPSPSRPSGYSGYSQTVRACGASADIQAGKSVATGQRFVAERFSRNRLRPESMESRCGAVTGGAGTAPLPPPGSGLNPAGASRRILLDGYFARVLAEDWERQREFLVRAGAFPLPACFSRFAAGSADQAFSIPRSDAMPSARMQRFARTEWRWLAAPIDVFARVDRKKGSRPAIQIVANLRVCFVVEVCYFSRPT